MSTEHLPTVIILASGKGERFIASGGIVHKLQALLQGKPVLQWTLDAVRASGLPWHLEDAGHPGMGDSIAAAVRATRQAHGWLILPADLPLIKPSTLQAIAAALQQLPAHQKAIYPEYAGQRGHPVGFSRACLEILQNLKGNKGLALVLPALGATKLIVDDVGCVTDIDTVQDLDTAQRYLMFNEKSS